MYDITVTLNFNALKCITMFVHMTSIKALRKKIHNSGYKKKERVKVYARTHKKEHNLIDDWVEYLCGCY